MTSPGGVCRSPAPAHPGGRALGLVHVLANRGRVRTARRLAGLLARSARGLTAARAGVLRETLDLELSGSDGSNWSTPRARWAAGLEGLLTELDRELAVWDGASPGPVDAVVEALVLAFHPRLHQGAWTSPLVADPRGFAALLEGHRVMALLRGNSAPRLEEADAGPADRGCHPEDATRSDVAVRPHPHPTVCSRVRPPAVDTPVRLLVLTDTSLTFMTALLQHWGAHRDVELRVRDLREEGTDASWWSLRATVGDRLAGVSPVPPTHLSEDLRWADVVWVEWGGALAARLSAVDTACVDRETTDLASAEPQACGSRPRLIVRLHRYEAFTMYPQVTHWEGVDDLVLVSAAVGRVLESTVPDIARRTRIQVAPNVVDLHRFALPKRSAAARTLALIGWDRPVKDPDWALDVLDVLRAHDPSWRLLLVGRAPTGGDGTAEGTWAQSLNMRVSAHGSSVVTLGRREDIPEVLRDASVILSSSLVESAHLALQEGTASGCLPVVRNWPGVAAVGGPLDIYPRDWVVVTPEQGARRILQAALSAEAGGLGPAGSPAARTASRWVLDHLDASTTLPLVDEIIGVGQS